MDAFAVIADPHRRDILDRLRTQASDVGALVRELQLPQPLVSKHLRVLRDSGLVVAEIAGKRRIYRLADQPLHDVFTWMQPFAQLWSDSFDRLADVLDMESEENT